jgi:hypothetical protein
MDEMIILENVLLSHKTMTHHLKINFVKTNLKSKPFLIIKRSRTASWQALYSRSSQYKMNTLQITQTHAF